VVRPSGYESITVGLLLIVTGAVAGAVLAVAGLIVSRALRGRRRGREQLERVLVEVQRALTDPLLVHQARRRIRQHQTGDR
jgi:hypothetical protein